jgi:hypothetical protein
MHSNTLSMKHFSLLIIIFLFSVIQGQAQKRTLTIGSGGGFSGAATIYKIAEDGKVWRGKGLGEIAFTECSKIKGKQARKFLNGTSTQVAGVAPMSYPGNMYYFISIIENGKENKITWGDTEHPAPEAVKNLYKDIQAAIVDLKYKPVK